MATAYSAISSYSRVEIMHMLQEHPAVTISDLTKATGLHPNTVREHLQRLIEGGYVVPEAERRTTRGRPRILYSAVSGPDAPHSPIAQQRVREAAERGDLMRRVMPWTESELPDDAQHQLDALVEDLQDAGFDPIVDTEELTVDLTPCEHARSQAAHRDVLCAVHIALMQGVLSEAGGPLAVEGMLPACDPTQCHIQLTMSPAPVSDEASAAAYA
ncbi:winged helix-turn-helix transcriptional regulator [Microbacterium protaetiae]|uniref:Winged helix-turn-helix transcriptional regulator n=1 Tax=Microbacterium protaetiae TaxID=2509458 RepID=A0A4P6EGJ2_9MICO|nr:winged helix-turn-helix transcriptional regulator [Microbacterium protaetiae]QAY60563.1 winged helix-turn-helix transcriptional regulator [Microbacterium protaetiae]